MVVRVADLSITTSLVNRLHVLQQQVLEKQTQVSSEKKSSQYAGISRDSQRLVNLENLTVLNSRYMSNNELIDTRLQVQNNAYKAVEKTITDMRGRLETFLEFSTSDKTAVDDIQDWAFKSLQAIESQLNAFVDGQYLFAGSRTHTKPVDFGLTDLAAFQAKYDGEAVSYPTSRDAHLANLSLSADLTGNTDWLVFTEATNTISATSSSFGNLDVGSVFTVSGTASNDGTYEVTSLGAFNTDANDAAPTITLPNTSTLTAADFTDLSFTAPLTVAATAAGSLSSIAVGDQITISGATDSGNNGTYVITSNDGTTMTVAPTEVTVNGIELTTDAADTTADIELPLDSITLTNTDYGTLTFTNPDTIDATTAGAFSEVEAGDVIVISNANNAANNGSYTVASVNGTFDQITIVKKELTDEGSIGAEVDGTIAASSWYKGDDTVLTHRIDKDFTVDMDINAIHPAFEKAIRAMGIIAQGEFGTAGGLDQNENRILEARWLLDSALDEVTGETSPFGQTEMAGDMISLGFNIGFKQILIQDTSDRFTKLDTVLKGQAADIENVDLTLAIAEFTDSVTAMQAAYQAFAKTQGLSLSDYL